MVQFLVVLALVGVAFLLLGVRLFVGKTFKKSGCGSVPVYDSNGELVRCDGGGCSCKE